MRLLFVLLLVSCGGDPVHHLPDAPCVPGTVTMAAAAPSTYACHDPFKVTLTMTNDSCEAVDITDFVFSETVVQTNCTPFSPDTINRTASVAVGATAQVLDFTGSAFCCTAPGPCPTPFQCDATFTYTANTAMGPISGTSTAHVSLDGCTEVCP